MLIGFYGYKGSGKTLGMVWIAYLLHKKGKRKVLSNLELGFEHEIIDIEEVLELSKNITDSIILLDEIHTIADSRVSGTQSNRALSYFILQSRHRSCDVLYTTQFAHQTDKRIRQNTDIKVICENLNIDSDKDGNEDVFRFTFIDKRSHPVRIKVIVIYGKPIFELYNTDFIINPFDYKKNKKKNKKKK